MNDEIEGIITGDEKVAAVSLKAFLKKNGTLFSFEHLRKHDTYTLLWQHLCKFIADPNAGDIHLDVLNSIRVLSRDKHDLDTVITAELINTLLHRSGIKTGDFYEDNRRSVALESQKCLCNIVFNSPIAAKLCSANGTLEGIAERLKQVTSSAFRAYESLFFDMKLLFIITALSTQSRTTLRDNLDGFQLLINTIEHMLQQHPKLLPELHRSTFCEMTKALFNATVMGFDDKTNTQSVRLVTLLRKLLLVECEHIDARHELTSHIVNLLTNVPNSAFSHLYITSAASDSDEYFENNDMKAVCELVAFLQRSLMKQPDISHQHEHLSPVLVLFLRATTTNRAIRKFLRQKILPPLKDARQRPEEGSSLRNYMCRLLTTPITEVRDLAAELLFFLCKENVNRMVKYTGYGNAAGLFARRGLLGGRSTETASRYSSESEDSDTEEYKGLKHGINPVLGCYEPPRPNPTADMTEEQKEYEAMQLVELMDRMSKTGIVQPCKVGADGKPIVIEHLAELQPDRIRRIGGDASESSDGD